MVSDTGTVGKGIVAVQDQVSTAGVVSFWHLSGVVRAEALQEAWAAEGLDSSHLPTLPTPRAALGRAVNEIKERRQLVRVLEDGWAFVSESERDGKLRYVQLGTVKLDVVGRLQFSDDTPGEIRVQVGNDYNRILFELSHQDITAWVTDQAKRLNGTALRDTGGVWYLPQAAVEEWRKIARVLRKVSGHLIYEIPALKSNEAIEAILAALSREAEDEAAAMEAQIVAGDLGSRALQTRQARATRLEQKLSSYEEALGRAMPELSVRLEGLRANLAAALLAAEAAEAKEV